MGVDDQGTAPTPVFVPPAATDAPAAKPILGATTTPWVLDLIARFRAAGGSMRVCEHLYDDPGDAAVWQASVPDLRSCRRAACTGAVAAALQERLGHPPSEAPTRCTTCGRVGVVVRGVGVAVGPTMLRGTVCEECLATRPVPTPLAATAPVAPVAPTDALVEVAAEPLADDREPSAADGQERIPLDAIGRRALRRGALLAGACARTTAPGLHPDQAVVGGLMARAAALATGLGVAPAGGPLVHDLAFRSLVQATTTLWWLLRADPIEAAAACAAFREEGPASGAGGLRDRLRALGREADLATLLPVAPDAAPGSWPELAAAHLAERPDGFALALDAEPGAVGPLSALVAGEHLSLACADYADRMPTEVDADEVRRLAEEVTTLRAAVASSAIPSDGTTARAAG